MSLLYKVIRVAFLGEHMVDLKRGLGLSLACPLGLSSPTAVQEKLLKDEHQQSLLSGTDGFKASFLKQRLWFGEGTTVHHSSFCFGSDMFISSFIF